MRQLVLWELVWLGMLWSVDLQAQNTPRRDLTLVWYNTENLFYPDIDSLPGDEEFTPEGVYHWTWARYRKKLTSLAKVIIASGGWEPPGVVGLCEVENARVLEDLAAHPVLAPYHYRGIHQEGPDHRGMEVACLVREELFRTIQWEYIAFKPPVTATRSMMHITLGFGVDTLDLFLVHLISKYGGAGATARLRWLQAEQLVRCMDSVYTLRSKRRFLAAGDFNDEFSGYSLEPLRGACFNGDTLLLLDPKGSPGNSGSPGSYKYRGKWSYIDHILKAGSQPWSTIMVSVLALPPLLTEDQEFGGMKPKRTYEGYVYRDGVSDHLPLVARFTFSPPSDPP